jgi:hypothetical protein
MESVRSRPILCPSAQPEMEGAKVFGIVNRTGDESRVSWLEKPVPLNAELLALTGSVPAARVMRISAPCQESACCHFDGADCRLATRLVQLLPAVVESLPPCQIRPDCRWFLQEGRSACGRCPQIVTDSPNPTKELSIAASPQR